MSARVTALALLVAVLLETGLGLLAPAASRLIDPLLIVVVYAAVTRGELAGMLAGAVAGWLADAAFGPRVLGLSALARLGVGWAVGVAGSRLMLAGMPARLLVLVAATLADARLLEWLGAGFGVDVIALPPRQLAARAVVNAGVGVLVYFWFDRRLRSEETA